jgi:DNA processing protein
MQIPTVGVLGHGLDSIYPAQHRSLAKEMLNNGGLLTEFRIGTLPDKHNFPKRNRIVAGMTDATIVIETDIKGGSMITAELAVNYHRDLFAVPGKITDSHSQGCLRLIQQNKAVVFSNAIHLAETMGWLTQQKNHNRQKEIFIDLTKDETLVVQLLTENTSLAVDDLFLRSGFSSSQMAAIILQLELKNVIRALPGKHFTLT